VDSKA